MSLLLVLALSMPVQSAVVRGSHPLSRSAAIMAATRQVCGDGVVESPEACDDGNIAASDGCDASCTVEAGWACTGSPSICADDPTLWAPLQTDLVDDVAGATVNYTRATAATGETWADCATTPVATLSTIASGNPRFNTLCAGSSAVTGLLVEPAATNLALQSENFGTTWLPQTGLKITTDAVASPFGTNGADYFVATSDATTHINQQAVGQTSGVSYTVSFYAKAATQSWSFFQLINVSATAYYDLSDCSVGNTSGTATFGGVSVGGGWCRFWATRISDITAARNHSLRPAEGNGDASFDVAGDTNSIAVYGFQVEVTNATGLPSSYIPTTTAAVTRNADVLYYSKAAPAAGSLYLSVLCPSVDLAADVAFATYSDGTADNRITLQGLAAGDVAKLAITTGTVEQAAVTGTTDLYDGALHTLRATWDSSGAALYVDGASEGTPDTNGVTVPTTTRLYLASGTGTLQSGCIIAPLKDYDEVVVP